MTLPHLDRADTAAVSDFIRANTILTSPPLLPEIKLHLAEQSLPIWQKTEDELGEINVPPPYWAFAWAGGQALARYLLDNPEISRERHVLDLGTGSGINAIAAKMAGASQVLANDIDRLALSAVALNATANSVLIEISPGDLLHLPPQTFGVILVGDLFYERQLADKVLAFIEAAAADGATVLIGDPKRNYFPQGRFTRVADYQVPVSRELEDADVKPTAVWRLQKS